MASAQQLAENLECAFHCLMQENEELIVRAELAEVRLLQANQELAAAMRKLEQWEQAARRENEENAIFRSSIHTLLEKAPGGTHRD